MSQPAVRLEALTKQYGGATVLDIRDYAFEAGRIHALVGPNGAGKTTLLRIVSGLVEPSSGQVHVFGAPLPSLAGHKRLAVQRRMAFVAQKPYLFRSSVRRNIEYPLSVRGVAAAERTSRADAAMQALGIAHLAGRKAAMLSAGEAQRTALARALVSQPELLLLDEPLASLDAASAPLVERVLAELAAQDVTVILATHLAEQAYHYSANVLRLERGRIAPPAIENIVEGELVGDEAGGASLVLDNGCRICVVSDRRGRVRAAVLPEDVIVSATRLDSSARNCFKGRLTTMRERQPLVYVTADVGFALTSVVTAASCRRLALTIGSEVFMTFKATSVHIF